MAKVIYYPNLVDESSKQVNEDTTLFQWLKSQVRLPRGIRIFLDNLAEDCDITDRWVVEPELLERDAVYYVAVLPRGGGGILNKIIDPFGILLPQSQKKPSVKISTSRAKSANNDLTDRTNQQRTGSRIADIRGTVRSVPDLLMNYTVFIDCLETEVQLLCVSEGALQLTDFRDGDTPLQRISGAAMNKYEPHTSPGFGTPSQTIGGVISATQYPVMVATPSNEIDGPELKPPNYYEFKKVTLKLDNTGTIYITSENDFDMSTIVSPGGQITITDCNSWEPVIASPGTYKRHDLSGTYDVELVSDSTVSITPTSGWSFLSSTPEDMHLEAYQLTSGDWSFTTAAGAVKFTFAPSFTIDKSFLIGPYTVENSPEIMVNISAPNGIYKDDGNVHPISIVCRVYVSNADNPSDPEITHDVTISSRDSDSTGSTLRFTNPYPVSALVSMRRITDTDKGFGGSVIDEVKWRDLYAVTPITPRDYGDVTLLHTLTRATDSALRVKERKLSCWATRLVNGQPLDNIADVVISMHIDPRFGRRSIDSLNVANLRETEAQMISFYNDPDAVRVGYTFDDASSTYEECLLSICKVVFINPTSIGSVINFWADLPQSVSAMQFGHMSKVPASDKRTRVFNVIKNYTGVQVAYFDPNSRTIENVTVGDITNLLKIENTGAITRKSATWRANREWNKLRFQRITHTCDALDIGLMCIPGMRIDMIDNTRTLRNEGFIQSQDGLTLTLSDEITTDLTASYSIVLTRKDGSIEGIPVTIIDNYTVRLAQLPLEAIYTGYTRDKTAYSLSTDDQRSKLAMLVTDVDPRNDDGNYTVGITAINYDSRYWG